MRYLLLAMSAVVTSCAPSSADEESSKLAEATADDAVAAAADEVGAAADAIADGTTVKGWSYDEAKDEMRGEVTKLATVQADDSIVLNFPYGESSPELIVRQDPKYGFDIMVRINGQFSCNGYTKTTFSVKFDDGPIKTWNCTGAESGSNDVLFINNEQKFLQEIKRAKSLIVEAEVYDAGRQQMKFSVAGLKWD